MADFQYPKAHPPWSPVHAGGLGVNTYQWPPTLLQGFAPAYQWQTPFTNEMWGLAPYEPFAAVNGDAHLEILPDQGSNNWQHFQESHGQPEVPLNNSGPQLDMANASSAEDPRFADPTDAAGLHPGEERFQG